MRRKAFSLVELMAVTAVLAMLIIMVTLLFNSATSVTTLGSRRLEADSQARSVFGRMSVDLLRMVRRADLDYYLKSPGELQNGNDQLAFFSEVQGYPTAAAPRSSLSLAAYRVNQSSPRLERLAKGLAWNGAVSGDTLAFLPSLIKTVWPAAANQEDDDDFELFGPDIFRFEYSYLLKGRKLVDGTSYPATLSLVPWDTRMGSTRAEGLRDVAAILVTVAIVDPKSRILLTANDLIGLSDRMKDASDTRHGPELEAQWKEAILTSTLPPTALASIRVYRRSFPFPQ